MNAPIPVPTACAKGLVDGAVPKVTPDCVFGPAAYKFAKNSALWNGSNCCCNVDCLCASKAACASCLCTPPADIN